MSVDATLLRIVVCPACHGTLEERAVDTTAGAAADLGSPSDESTLVCTACGLVYPVRSGIPVLLVDEARRPA
ncbi:Trm112 family protein [Nocardioides sp. ChNu-99]|uniref:Trm112 family protein n=1 Tax=Nocardioides sp. ChNu-99 TaxID=2839897 RepID=UPI0024060ADA|nr:Trm112 family protein [Nocardioides sp. ChNu-99]MDF9717559.1 Trm112 family protein [Nocardioides sp. ChNu-99]